MPTEEFIRQVAIQVVQYYSKIELPLLPTLTQNAEIVTFMDQRVHSLILELRTKFLAGESVDETRSVEYEYKTYASLWDHTKDSFKNLIRRNNWKWFPSKLFYKIKVEFKAEKRYITVPVKVLRVCPHVDKKFENYSRDAYYHAAFLIPSELDVPFAISNEFARFAFWIRTTSDIHFNDARDEIARAAERVARQFKARIHA